MKPFHFMQLADPQFGQFARFSGISDEEIAALRARNLNVKKAPAIDHFREESRLFEESLAEANRLKPAFVVVCGDMVNTPGDARQTAEVWRIASGLDDDIPIYWVPGNHDVCSDTVVPDQRAIRTYRSSFGRDYHAFHHDAATFLAVNSCVLQQPEQVAEEHEAQLKFIEETLKAAKARGSEQVIVFSHHPLFMESADEPDSDFPWALSPPNQKGGYWTIPRERRLRLVDLFTKHGVSHVFAGHWHRNHYASDSGLDVVVTGAVGYPLGDDPSGYRIVRVSDDGVAHDYYAFGDGPASA